MAAAIIRILCTSAIFMIVTTASSHHQAIKGVYYPSWARDNLSPSSIKTNLFTHIYYAFLTPNTLTFEFDSIDQTESLFLLNFTSTLHAKNPPVRTLFSVGGAAEGPALFSRMASTTSSRAAFINSSIWAARQFGFDGIDLDWEFPQDNTDMENLSLLLEEWRAAVHLEAASGGGRRPLLLTAAVYYSADGFLSGPQRAYPAESITRNLDWINVMNYDYRGGWDTTATGAHAALFDPRSNVSTSYGLGSWIRVGVPGSKLIMGMPLYGRTWRLRDPKLHGIGAPAVDVGPGDGVLTFAEVVGFNRDNKAKVVFDSETVSVYSVAGSSWVGYDDKRSVTVKIGYARALGLRGYFFWAIHGDYNWTISQRASQLWSP